MKVIAKIVLIITFILILLIPGSLALGTCSLNRIAPYEPGETGTLVCVCTLPNEENQAGFIVYKLDNGTIISSNITTSGLCRTNVFGGSVLFDDFDIGNGTAYFSAAADGTGIPTNWNGASDITTDDFEIIRGHGIGCIITDVKVPVNVGLGISNYNVFRIIDSDGNFSISGINCKAYIYSADGSPLSITPYGTDRSFYKSGHEGVLGLNYYFNEVKYESDTSYNFQLFCNCYNETGSTCYNDENGDQLGYHSCELSSIFTTNGDYRPLNNIKDNMLSMILVFIFFSVFLFVIGLINGGDKLNTVVDTKEGKREILDVTKWQFWASYSAYAFSVIELLLLLGFIYGVVTSLRIELLLQLNFWFMLVISVFLFILTMILSIVQIFTFREVNKWGEKW